MQEMTELEKLTRELKDAWCEKCDGWEAVAKRVRRIVLEARIKELEVIHGKMDEAEGDFSFAKYERLAELKQQLEGMK